MKIRFFIIKQVFLGLGTDYKCDGKLIAPYSETKYVVYSATLFLYPSYVCYIYNLNKMSLFILMTYLISVNFWRDCRYSWRRNLDFFWARLGTCVMLYNNYYYITDKKDKLISYSLFPLFTYCFYKSIEFKNTWYKYHMLFHAVATFQMMLVIKNMILIFN